MPLGPHFSESKVAKHSATFFNPFLFMRRAFLYVLFLCVLYICLILTKHSTDLRIYPETSIVFNPLPS
jgi:hypothetical protein